MSDTHRAHFADRYHAYPRPEYTNTDPQDDRTYFIYDSEADRIVNHQTTREHAVRAAARLNEQATREEN